MRSITKVFFLGALFALVALAPNAAAAATNEVNSITLTVTPSTTISVPNAGVTLTINGQAFKSDNSSATIGVASDINATLSQTFGTLTTPILNTADASKFSMTYTVPAMTALVSPTSISVTINTRQNFAVINFVASSTVGGKGAFCANPGQQSTCDTDFTCEPSSTSNGVCVPLVSKRGIGSWCNTSNHCRLGTSILELTCDDRANRCVGATANVSCADSSGISDPKFGTPIANLDSDMRCSTSLVCDAQTLKCANDFGQGKVPADRLGETATDIRDQIRNLINIALGFLGVIGVIVALYGGFTWMTAFGDDEKVGKAKKTLVAGIIGIIIIGIAWTIVSYVINITKEIS